MAEGGDAAEQQVSWRLALLAVALAGGSGAAVAGPAKAAASSACGQQAPPWAGSRICDWAWGWQ